MKRIKLTKGKTKGKYALVDNQDFEWLSQWEWYFTAGGHINGKGYAARKQEGKQIYMHREIIKPGKKETDHINGDGLDNRRENLRAVTHQENIWNNSARCISRTGIKGVSKCPGGRYRTRIAYDYKQFCIGVFDTIEEAEMAYHQAAILLRGQ